jgi:hypothetical protein
MHRFLFAAGVAFAPVVAVVLPTPVCAAATQTEEPTLLGLVTARLGMVAELRPALGVRITAATFSRGVVRIVGTVTSEAQLERLKREVEALRPRMRSELDLRVTSIDLSGVTVIPRPRPEEGPKETPGGKPEERRPTSPPVVQGGPWPPPPVFVVPYGYCPPFPPGHIYRPGGPYPPGPPLWDPIIYGPWGR